MKKTILIIAILSIFNLVVGQGLQLPENIQSPNAAGLGKYGDVPVSYYTGTPNISIPLHTLNVRGIDLNIGLSYDASGIRINSHPGWVGQNWSLSAGGVITRTVNYAPDERSDSWSPYGPSGYFYHCTELTNSSAYGFESLRTLAINRGHGYDYQPDIFTFNFMGITGKFFMGNDGEWKVSSDHNMKVIYDNNLITPLFESLPYSPGSIYPKVIGGFKLIDGDGTTYVFGYDPSSSAEDKEKQLKAIEYSVGFFNQTYDPDIWISNAWHLVKVIDKFGIELFHFEYSQDRFVAEFYRNTSYRFYNYVDGGIGPSCLIQEGMVSEELAYNGSLILPSYLTKITTYNNFIVDFNKEISTELEFAQTDIQSAYNNLIDQPGIYPLYFLQVENDYTGPMNSNLATNFMKVLKWFKLSNIQISNASNSIKKIEFKYNNNLNERLNLLELRIYANDNLSYNTYNFNYNSFGSLPKYLSKMVDHWGYYNGKAFTRITTDNIQNHYGERNSNQNYLTIGMLSSIIYPTGGHTKFEYEGHKYAKIMSDDGTTSPYTETGNAGGARIKRIINYDGNIEITRTFKYVTSYETNKNSTVSSGILTRKPKYYWSDFPVSRDSWGSYYRQTVFSFNSIIPLANSFGSHIGYSEVAEIREDGSYTLYKYNDYAIYQDNGPVFRLNDQPSPYDSYSDRSLMRGKPYMIRMFDSHNQLVKQSNIKYRDQDGNPFNSQYVYGANARYMNACPGSAESVYLGESYRLYYFDFDIYEEEEITYYGTQETHEKITYLREDINPSLLGNKSNIRLLKELNNTISDGSITTEFSYPLDLSGENYMQDLINNFRINELIRTKTSKGSKETGCIKSSYKQEAGKIVLKELLQSKTNEASLLPEMVYDKYIDGRLVQFHKPNGIYTTIIWGYHNEYPIVKIENASYSDVSSYYNNLGNQSNSEIGNCFDSENGSEKNLRIALNTLRTNLPNAMISTYTYDPGIGITSITDPAGKIEYYRYDNFNRLKTIFNSDEKIIKTYEYKFKETPFLTFSINGSSSYELGDIISSDVSTIGGSGNFTYRLELQKNGANVAVSNTNSISCRALKSGNYNLNCTVTDTETGIVQTKTELIYVQSVSCQFVDVFPPRTMTSTMRTAKIYVPIADVVKLSYFRPSSDGIATVRINNNTYTIEPYTRTDIEVVTNTHQSYIECKIQVEGSTMGGSAELEIMGLKNNTASIGSHKKISIPSPY